MKPEIEALIKKAKSSLESAKLLFDKDFFEFAASRAYYTMFYIAEAFLLNKNLSFSKHSAVISAFGKHLTKTEEIPQKFHRYLIEGFECRNIGDYDLVIVLSKEKAYEQITRAEEFIELAEKRIKQ